jgi:hypothetical protein
LIMFYLILSINQLKKSNKKCNMASMSLSE